MTQSTKWQSNWILGSGMLSDNGEVGVFEDLSWLSYQFATLLPSPVAAFPSFCSPVLTVYIQGRLLPDDLTDKRLQCLQFLGGLHCQGPCVHSAQERFLFKGSYPEHISFFLWSSSNFPQEEACLKPYTTCNTMSLWCRLLLSFP